MFESDGLVNSGTVFISYSHDSPEHCAKVLALSDLLRKTGIACILDQYENGPEQGWIKWMLSHITKSDYIITIFTETYFARINDEVAAEESNGCKFESLLSYQAFYDNGSENKKILPVIFCDTDRQYIPAPLRSFEFYCVANKQGYENLYRKITNQPKIIRPEVGPPLQLKTGVNLNGNNSFDPDRYNFETPDESVSNSTVPNEKSSTKTQTNKTKPPNAAPHISAGNGSVAVAQMNGSSIHIINSNTDANSEDRAQKYKHEHEQKYQRQYLQGLICDCAGLEWLNAFGLQDESTLNISLDAIYTALLTHTQKDNHKALMRERELDGETQALSIVEVLNREQRLVLTGEPGGGKSAFVNYLAICMAGEILGSSKYNLKTLTDPLPDEKGKPGKESQPWDHGALLPVRVILRDFASSSYFPPAGQRSETKNLLQFIRDDLEQKGFAEYFPMLEAQLREQNKTLVLFDGLDEVAQAGHKRERMIQCLGAFSRSFQQARVLVTCRPYAYAKSEWQLKGFKDSTLAEFGPGQICRFVDRWYALQRRVDRNFKQARVDLLKQVLLQRPALNALVRRPLLLTLTVYLHANHHELPERRADLYEQLLELLIEKWEAARFDTKNADEALQKEQYSLASCLQVGMDEIRLVLERLAFEAHAGQMGLTGTADIPAKELTHQLVCLAEGEGVGGPGEAINALAISEYLRNRVGILYQRGGESDLDAVYSFPHRSFQEYLSACYFRREEQTMFQHFKDFEGDEDWIELAAYLGRSDPDRWREVILLAGGIKSFKDPKPVWSLLDNLLAEMPASGLSLKDAWGLRLAAEILAENLKRENLSHKRERSLQRIREAVPQLLQSDCLKATERVAAGKHLATIGDQREEIMTVDSMKFCYVPSGPFFLGSLDDKDSEWFDAKTGAGEHRLDKAYWLAQYPVSIAQFQEFVDEEASFVPKDPDYKNGPANTPVVWISWDEAMAFCNWLTQRWQKYGWLPTGYQVSLPSEPEWEKSAKGGYRIPTGDPVVEPVSAIITCDSAAVQVVLTEQENPGPQRAYPWGNESDLERMNVYEGSIGKLSTPGVYTRGVSPYGCEDMSGNVWEWTRSLALDYPYPDTARGRRKREGEGSGPRALRGGSFNFIQALARCAFRAHRNPDERNLNIGFRVVLSPYL